MVIYYLVLVNAVAFLAMGLDKRLAKIEGARRIPEKTLLGLAVIGGSVGAIFGMKLFRPKTLHNQFRYGLPLILIVQLVLLALMRGDLASLLPALMNLLGGN